MAVYVYTTRDGVESFERSYPIGTNPARLRRKARDGRVRTFYVDIAGMHRGRKPVTAGLWPLRSVAAGVAPAQIAELRAWTARHGCPTDFTDDGDAVLTSRQHRQRYLRLRGLIDRDGGYGD